MAKDQKMQDQNTQINDNVLGASDAAAAAKEMTQKAEEAVPGIHNQRDYEAQIISKINDSENILVTLSRDPSVDEMAAAIGLTMYLDSLQKHATAIYSGKTPDVLQFLQPEGTFESNTSSLQDFIIALNKDKADHLRYKLEGDFVKVYITPYKTTLSESDLQFSHGDFNVDLVLALGVPTAGDLDAALTEYGRIMHDATTVDITCGLPGKFGEIEWSEPGASSVSEMIAKLIFKMRGDDYVLDKEIANALLTGIVASTSRFSNERTSSETMQIASKLMMMGADQQLIAMHVMENEASEKAAENEAKNSKDGNLLIGKDYQEPQKVENAGSGIENEVAQAAMSEVGAAQAAAPEVGAKQMAASEIGATQVVAPEVGAPQVVTPEVGAKQMAASEIGATQTAGVEMPAQASEQIPVLPKVMMSSTAMPTPAPTPAPTSTVVSTLTPAPTIAPAPATATASTPILTPAPTIAPAPATMTLPGAQTTVGVPLEPISNVTKDYGKMIEQALAEPLPVETAASAAGLLGNDGVGVLGSRSIKTGMINPAVVAAPKEENAAVATIKTENVSVMPNNASATPNVPTVPAVNAPAMPNNVSAAPSMPTPAVNAPTASVNTISQPQMQTVQEMLATNGATGGHTILPPAPKPEVGNGLMPPVMPSVATPIVTMGDQGAAQTVTQPGAQMGAPTVQANSQEMTPTAAQPAAAQSMGAQPAAAQPAMTQPMTAQPAVQAGEAEVQAFKIPGMMQ